MVVFLFKTKNTEYRISTHSDGGISRVRVPEILHSQLVLLHILTIFLVEHLNNKQKTFGIYKFYSVTRNSLTKNNKRAREQYYEFHMYTNTSWYNLQRQLSSVLNISRYKPNDTHCDSTITLQNKRNFKN